ncbi:MAG: sensor protein [Gemmatimonadetes bacterium]|nr:sensor protein [Gemmatimonadota bacterium]
MVPRPSTHADALDLVDRTLRADTAAQALALVADAAREATGSPRALVLVERRGVLRAEVSRGWSDADARAAESAAEDARSAVGVAFHAGRTHVGGGPGCPPGETPCAAVPLMGLDGRVFAVVLLDALPARAVRAAATLAERAAPAVERLAELERLRRAGDQTERQRELLNTLLNALPDPLLVTDARHGIVLENRRAAALFEHRADDGGERRRIVELNNLLFSSFLTRAGQAPPDEARELNLVEPDGGEDLVFEVLSSPLPGHLAGEGARLAALRNVTALKRASTELEHQFRRARQAELKARRERDRLNLILENVGDPIVVTDEDGAVLLVNREGERLFRVAADVPEGAPERTRVAANDAAVLAFVAELAASPLSGRAAEILLADPATGGELPVEVVSGKILNEHGETSAVVSILHDLTKSRDNERLAAELARLNEGLEDRIRGATAALEERNRRLEWQSQELERASRLKSEFLASMSHELRTPINALLGYASLMRDRIYGDLTPRQEESLVRMHAASRHLLALVNDILDLAKIEAGKMPVHVERFDLPELVLELSETVEPLVRAKGLLFRMQVEEGLPALDTDRTKVKQILLNLLSNAVKFTHVGEVAIEVRGVRGGMLEAQVSDTGIGIPAADLDGIFDDFRQVDQSSTREYGGTGLGLSIVRKLLALLGGSVKVRSVPEQGSVFTVRFPRRSKPVNPDAASAD